MQARTNLRRCFFVALQLNNPRLLGVVLLYFIVGVSPAACTKALVPRGRRINCGELLSPKAVSRSASPLPSFSNENLASPCLNHGNALRIGMKGRKRKLDNQFLI